MALLSTFFNYKYVVLGVDGLSSGGIEMLGEGLAQDVLQVSGLQHDLEHEELQRDADTINLSPKLRLEKSLFC